MTDAARSQVHARIAAIGTAVPGVAHEQRAIAERMVALHGLDARGARRLRAFYRRTRVDARHSVLPDDWSRATDRAFFAPGVAPPGTAARMAVFERAAPPLAAAAACRALSPEPGAWRRATDPATIDHLIVVSCTGFMAPGLDASLCEALGLRHDVGRTLLGFQGCHAGLTALRLAADTVTAHPRSRVLVVAVELSTLHFRHPLTKASLLANALFGDGAAAVIVEGREVPDPPAGALAIDTLATFLVSEGARDMVWRVGDRGFALELSSRLPDLLARHVPVLLREAGVKAGEGSVALHPGGAAIIDRLEEALATAPGALAASRAVLRRFGNLSSATVFFVLDAIARAPRQRNGLSGAVTALALGPGLTVELARLVPGGAVTGAAGARAREESRHAQGKDAEACSAGPIFRHALESRS